MNKILTKVLLDNEDITAKVLSFDIYEEVGKISRSLVLSVGELTQAPSVDKEVRLVIFMKRDEKESQFLFVLTSLKKEKEIITINARSKGVLLEESKSIKENISEIGDAKEILTALTQGLNTDFTEFTNFSLNEGGYFAKDYRANAIYSLLNIIDADVFLRDETLVFSEKLYIKEHGSLKLDESDVLEAKSEFVPHMAGSVLFNYKDESINSRPTMSLAISPSPQPLSPSFVQVFKEEVETTNEEPKKPCMLVGYGRPGMNSALSAENEYLKNVLCGPNATIPANGNYTHTGAIYKVKPAPSLARLFYSPLFAKVNINGFNFSKTGYTAIEKHTLEMDTFIELAGGIKSIVAVSLNDSDLTEFSFKASHNVLMFNAPLLGELKVAYETDIYKAVFPTSTDQFKEYNINIKMLNQSIFYKHTYEARDFFPLPYYLDLNLITDWGIDPDDASSKEVIVTKVISESQTQLIQSVRANPFAELRAKLSNYGIYKLLTKSYEPLFISFFVNSLSISLTPAYPPEEEQSQSESQNKPTKVEYISPGSGGSNGGGGSSGGGAVNLNDTFIWH